MKKSRLMRGVNVFSIIAIVVLWLVMFFIYTFFSARILEREEETMVMTARTMSNSMEQLIDEQENLLNVYFNRNHIRLFDEDITENIETILSESREQNGALNTDFIYISAETENILNFDGGLPHDIFDDIKEQEAALNKAKETDKAILAAWNRYDKNNYVLYLAKAVFVEGRCEGYVFEGIRLNEIYEIAMSEVELGAKANCKILDENSVIIMHTLPDQIGLNMLESLSDLPRKDRQTSRQAIQEEISGETGFSVNKAYWPDEPEWGSAEKIEAYTPVEVGDKRFYLILAAPRNDVMADVNQMLIYLMLLFFVFLLTGTLRILQLRARVRSEEHAREQLSYERELNETRQKLRAREDQDAKQDRLQTLGIMAGSMAHELNNAMTPILIYSDMLLDSYPEDQEIQEDVAQIRSSAQRCGELVHNLLIYGRQEKEEYKRQFYDAVPVFHNIISMLRQIKPDHVELRAVCALESAYLFGNAGAMRQIIVNLSTNAFYAMQEKGGVLDIFLGLSPENDSDLMLKVKDTGVGMSEEVMQRIFEAFYTTKPEGEGTGLGLSVVKRLVERQNGTISVISEPGAGTCFTVVVPQNERVSSKVSDEEIAAIARRPLRVFILDDEQDIVYAMRKSLKQTAWIVESENDPIRAYGKLRGHLDEWDLLITDTVMPGMEGTELAELLRAQSKKLKILLISGYTENQLEGYLQNGVIDGIQYKPILLRRLLRTVAEIMDEKRKFIEN